MSLHIRPHRAERSVDTLLVRIDATYDEQRSQHLHLHPPELVLQPRVLSLEDDRIGCRAGEVEASRVRVPRVAKQMFHDPTRDPTEPGIISDELLNEDETKHRLGLIAGPDQVWDRPPIRSGVGMEYPGA